MKRRVQNSYKILAVAVVASATGCAQQAAPANHPRPAVVEVTEEQTEAPVVAPEEPAPQPIVHARAEEPPPPPAAPDPALLQLANELQDVGEAKALANVKHFRPLCDKDGYPLVGNMHRKSPEPEYQPSAFCASVRNQGMK